MNWLFLLFLTAAAAGALATRRTLRRTHTVPGYSHTDGALLKIDPMPALVRGEDWDAVGLEEFHSAHRARVVLRLWARPTDLELLKELTAATAQQVAERTQAHVVYVEVHNDNVLRVAHMFAPDGRGWTGGDGTREIWHAT